MPNNKTKPNNKRTLVMSIIIITLIIVAFLLGNTSGKSESEKRSEQFKEDILKQETTLKGLESSIGSKNKILDEINSKVKDAQDKLNATNKLIEEKNSIHVKGEVKKSLYLGMTKLVGEIENGTNNPTSYWKVTATFYDESGKVLGTGFSNSLDELKPGATAPFEVSSYPDEYNAASYKLDVSAH